MKTPKPSPSKPSAPSDLASTTSPVADASDHLDTSAIGEMLVAAGLDPSMVLDFRVGAETIVVTTDGRKLRLVPPPAEPEGAS